MSYENPQYVEVTLGDGPGGVVGEILACVNVGPAVALGEIVALYGPTPRSPRPQGEVTALLSEPVENPRHIVPKE